MVSPNKQENMRKQRRITELREEYIDLMWNVKETEAKPSCYDWNALIIMEIQSINIKLARLISSLKSKGFL